MPTHRAAGRRRRGRFDWRVAPGATGRVPCVTNLVCRPRQDRCGTGRRGLSRHSGDQRRVVGRNRAPGGHRVRGREARGSGSSREPAQARQRRLHAHGRRATAVRHRRGADPGSHPARKEVRMATRGRDPRIWRHADLRCRRTAGALRASCSVLPGSDAREGHRPGSDTLARRAGTISNHRQSDRPGAARSLRRADARWHGPNTGLADGRYDWGAAASHQGRWGPQFDAGSDVSLL